MFNHSRVTVPYISGSQSVVFALTASVVPGSL